MSRSLEYFGPESDGDNLERERGQDLVTGLVGNLVANLVDIRTGSTVHWRLAFITTGLCRVKCWNRTQENRGYVKEGSAD